MFALLWVVGCTQYQTVEEACSDKVPGSSGASAAGVELFGRVGCYRALAGLDRARMNPRIGDAVQSHADYLHLNDVNLFDPFLDWTSETFGELHYTGASAYERLETAGYLTEGVGSAFVWEVLALVDPTRTYAELVDELMLEPFFRDVYLAPAWEGAGYAEFPFSSDGEELLVSYSNVVLYHPSGSHALKPVVYPIDGQLDVPTAWPNDYAADPYDTTLDNIPADAGMPITYTFGSNTLVAGLNPLDVSVVSSSIQGPEGEVEHVVLLPGLYVVGPVWSTAALIPTEPLVANATYTATTVLSWVERSNYTMTTTFTTGSAAP